jgi:hypothetical protein
MADSRSFEGVLSAGMPWVYLATMAQRTAGWLVLSILGFAASASSRW